MIKSASLLKFIELSFLYGQLLPYQEFKPLTEKKVSHKNGEAIQRVKPMHMKTVHQFLERDWHSEA